MSVTTLQRVRKAHADSVGEARASTLYFDRHLQRDAAKILPGEFYVTGEDMVLVTVLGSCVAACIRDPVRGIGGMNHFMLPEAMAGDAETPVSGSARYGAFAMELLINQLLARGARRPNLEAKVFGGANVMAGLTQADVGRRNAAFVLQFLKMEGIALAAKDLLDEFPRKIYYFPRTGLVRVKKLRDLHNDTIVEREQAYRRSLGAGNSGAIELFD